MQTTILTPDPPDERPGGDWCRIDADLVTTLCTVGFVQGRLTVGHPVEFSWDPAKLADEKETADAAAGIRAVVGGTTDTVRVVPAPGWKEGALITGAAGAASAPFASRQAVPTTEAGQRLREIAAQDENVGYRGYGAYTGFVDAPFTSGGAASIMSTTRSTVPDDDVAGERWRPPTYAYPGGLTQDDAAWGLLNEGKPIEGMQVRPCRGGDVVGYTHGMVQAVYRAVSTGPWCTPFEIAVGAVTTKVASCMACTLFMYAAGFPPSSIHLGRGDSWLPFLPAGPGDPGYSMPVDEAVRSTNLRWGLECRQHLELGLGLARDTGCLADDHAARLDALEAHLEDRATDPFAGSNLLLDALTVHASFTTRISRALGLGG